MPNNSPESHADLCKDALLILLLQDDRIETWIQPGFGRGPFKCHRQHDATARMASSCLTQVQLDVRRECNLYIIRGIVATFVH